MKTPHPLDLLYDHRHDPLGLWAEAHARACCNSTNPIRELTILVAEHGFLGHRSGHTFILYGPVARERFRAALAAAFPPDSPGPHPFWTPFEPAGPEAAALLHSLEECASRTKPWN